MLSCRIAVSPRFLKVFVPRPPQNPLALSIRRVMPSIAFLVLSTGQLVIITVTLVPLPRILRLNESMPTLRGWQGLTWCVHSRLDLSLLCHTGFYFGNRPWEMDKKKRVLVHLQKGFSFQVGL